jgi:WD40 repeat protein
MGKPMALFNWEGIGCATSRDFGTRASARRKVKKTKGQIPPIDPPGHPGLTLLRTLRSDTKGLVTKIAWSPDGATLAVPTQNGQVELWDPHRGSLRRTIDARGGTWITSVAWSPDGNYLGRVNTIRDFVISWIRGDQRNAIRSHRVLPAAPAR